MSREQANNQGVMMAISSAQTRTQATDHQTIRNPEVWPANSR